ncbi:hypothetical protein ACTFIU_007049 [Dictyostelium citrinum]
MSFLKKRKKKSTSTLTLNNSNSNNSNIVCVNNNNNNNNINSNNNNGTNTIINKKIKKLTSSTSCPNMLTVKEEENEKYNNNSNNFNDNSKDIIILNWNKYTDKLIKQGYLESCILDLESGDLNSSSTSNNSSGVGFTISYQEWQEIKNILQGSYLTTISCSKKRFYVVASNDFIIAGRDSQNQSFILRKTQTKAIIGIFDMNKLQIDNAHQLINDLYYEIIKDDKNEIYPVE